MNTSNLSGVYFVGLLTVVFIVLKLIGAIDLSWWWVLSPVLISTIIVLIILAIFFVIDVWSSR